MVIGLMQIVLAIIDSQRNVSLDFVHHLFCFSSYRGAVYGFWDKIFITGSCEAAATRNTLGAALSGKTCTGPRRVTLFSGPAQNSSPPQTRGTHWPPEDSNLLFEPLSGFKIF